MARRSGSTSRSSQTDSAPTVVDTRFHSNRAADPAAADGKRDPAPDNDRISGTRSGYAPPGADTTATTAGTLKRTVKEFSEDNLTDWAASLTYYGVLALFPALIALLSTIGLVPDPATLTK